jgi:homoserine kinase
LAVIEVRAPGSSANLGPGFDVLGLALDIYSVVATAGEGEPAEPTHPGVVAFVEAGGEGPLWVRTEIPMGRGLGYSASVRVAGAAAAYVQMGLEDDDAIEAALGTAAVLEGHSDNAAASAIGGAIIAAGDTVARIDLALEASVVVWVPNHTTAGTTTSRLALPEFIQLDDVVTNLGNLALLVTALTTGDPRALGQATRDLVHQPGRLDALPESAAVIEAFLELGAWGTWLSGSGPSVAAFVDPRRAAAVAGSLPPTGHAKVLAVDVAGATVLQR